MLFTPFLLTPAELNFPELKLSIAEIKFKENLKTLLHEASSRHDDSALIHAIKNAKLGALIKLSVQYKWIRVICHQRKLHNHWNEKWRKAGANVANEKGELPLPLSPPHEFQAQATCSSFDLLAGLYYFWKFEELAEPEKYQTHAAEALTYLRLSAQLGYGSAILTVINRHLDRLQTGEVTVSSIKTLETIGNYFATRYFGQGFYTLAIIYQHIAAKIPRLCVDPAAIWVLQKQYYQNACQALATGYFLLPFSEPMTNNLQGEGKLDNHCWRTFFRRCDELAEQTPSTREYGFRLAKNSANRLLAKFNLLAPARVTLPYDELGADINAVEVAAAKIKSAHQ